MAQIFLGPWKLVLDMGSLSQEANRETLFCLFVCVEVLRPSQPNIVMLNTVSLPYHTFTGQA